MYLLLLITWAVVYPVWWAGGFCCNQCREYHAVSVNNGDKPRIGGLNVNNYLLDNDKATSK